MNGDLTRLGREGVYHSEVSSIKEKHCRWSMVTCQLEEGEQMITEGGGMSWMSCKREDRRLPVTEEWERLWEGCSRGRRYSRMYIRHREERV